ncbi:hypothetical protein JOQ06_030439 [Pogonophryne albipinna]|uniref:Uncharacterized protein n=1 Tax=Pogonophryne albipinna TaxID=1090488 RepID=A0AAD6FH20_9TELE|nr:hypothetical protein JOQ06_030439 [Pogonophryne albipinna]
MDQCVEYVYILSANFTQRRRSVGGRHKPFPLDDGAHPSRPPWLLVGPKQDLHLLSQPPALGPMATCCQAYARCQL